MIIDLERLEKYKENNRIEAKKAQGGLPLSMWETYSAFANTLGGVILLGVEETEDRSLRAIGLSDPEGMRDEILGILSDTSRVSSNILGREDVLIHETEAGSIIAVYVPRASRRVRPVCIDGDPFNCYRRSGEGDFRMSRDEAEAMQRDASLTSPDMMIPEDVTKEDLSDSSVASYRRALRLFSPASFPENESDEDMLLRISALAKDAGGTIRPTLAGLLMFGKTDVLYSVIRDVSILYRRMAEDGSVTTEVTEMNLYDAYFTFSEKLRNDCEERFGGSLDITQRSAVSSALAEAFSNCLINSDYLYGGRISVTWKKDRISFTDPGLFRGEDPSTDTSGISDPRNALIQEMFNLIGNGRGIGSGISTILSVWADIGWARPVIRELFDPPRTVMSLCFTASPPADEPVPAEELFPQAVEYLTRSVSASPGDLARYLGISSGRARDILSLLCERDVVCAEDERMRSYRLKR